MCALPVNGGVISAWGQQSDSMTTGSITSYAPRQTSLSDYTCFTVPLHRQNYQSAILPASTEQPDCNLFYKMAFDSYLIAFLLISSKTSTVPAQQVSIFFSDSPSNSVSLCYQIIPLLFHPAFLFQILPSCHASFTLISLRLRRAFRMASAVPLIAEAPKGYGPCMLHIASYKSTYWPVAPLWVHVVVCLPVVEEAASSRG